MDYSDYDLIIERDLTVKACYKDLSPAIGEMKLDLEEIKIAIDHLEDEEREIDKYFIKNLGDMLGNALFSDGIKQHFDEAKKKSANRLRIRLSIESSEIANFPWEALRNNDNYLSVSVETPLIRFVPNGMSAKNFDKPLKILLISSNPSELGLPAVQVEREIKIIKESLKDETDIGNIELDPERLGDVDSIMNRLKEEKYNVIHFIGHGVFNDGKGWLALESSDGGLDLADHERIGHIFLNQKSSLGLVVLNACQGATTSAAASTSKAFTGLAPELIRMGVTSVIAMKYSISNPTAKLFSKEFYKNLLKMPIDENIQLVRQRILVDPETSPRDFITPVLFSNAPVIFSPKDTASNELTQVALNEKIEGLIEAWDKLKTGNNAMDEEAFWLMILEIYKEYKELISVGPKREIERMITIVPVLLKEMSEASLNGLDQEVMKLKKTIRLNYQKLIKNL